MSVLPPLAMSGAATGPGLRRVWPLAAVTAAVLLLHAWLLVGLPLGLGGPASGPARAVQVRQIVRPAAPPPAAEAPAAAAAAAAPQRPPPPPPLAPKPPREAAPLESATRAPDEPVVVPPAEPVVTAEPAPDAASAPGPTAVPVPVPVPAAEPAAPPEGTGSGGERMPVYPTRVPPAATLNYELRRGLLAGQGTLQWRPGPEGYQLSIEGSALGLPVLTWSSQGRLDAAGLAPERFVDQRRGRAGRSANFQRDRGVVSWSSTPAEAPLMAGAQDRLSFMVQLAAIVDAQPERYAAGERVVMQVVGARGDVDAWAFIVQGHEAVDVVGRRIEGALRLRRVPRKPYDTEVDVWLDPARQHLPARLRLTTAGGGDSMEFLLAP